MQFFKLQLGCLLVILFVEINYIRETLRGKIKCNKLFDALMVVAPWAVVFDGLTSWTVNHIDKVPAFLNRAAHLIFFIMMDLTIIITAEYMFELLIGFKKKNRKILLAVLGLLSLILIIAFIGDLQYIEGATTWYSMGTSVYICYGTVVFFYGLILFFVITRSRFLPKDKVLGTLSFILIAGIIFIVQIRFPEVLITSIFPMILLLGIYVDFENPSMRKVTMHHDEMTDGFAMLVESRDNNTGGHIKRTKAYVKLMLEKMKDDKNYSSIMNKDYMANVSNAAPLHDIGKIATPDSILQKPGKLTDEEYAIMKKHSADGGDIILNTFFDLDNMEFRQIAYEVARFHHEKYNGKGYPDGLKGEEIPLHARIMSIADVFDAVSQKRCYRDAMPIDKCFAIIENGIGTDFDPQLAKIFLESKIEVIQLMQEYDKENHSEVKSV
ncbi:MAG: HD-GYP domain-containing protein [Oscillospiraceae bacterium]